MMIMMLMMMTTTDPAASPAAVVAAAAPASPAAPAAVAARALAAQPAKQRYWLHHVRGILFGSKKAGLSSMHTFFCSHVYFSAEGPLICCRGQVFGGGGVDVGAHPKG
jgi:hypothetical protein